MGGHLSRGTTVCRDKCRGEKCPGGQLSWGDTCQGGKMSGDSCRGDKCHTTVYEAEPFGILYIRIPDLQIILTFLLSHSDFQKFCVKHS